MADSREQTHAEPDGFVSLEAVLLERVETFKRERAREARRLAEEQARRREPGASS